MTINQILDKAVQICKQSGVNDVSKILLAYVLKKEVNQLLQSINQQVGKHEEDIFFEYLEHYTTGKPFQYITNEQYFFNNNFYVDKNVLIPRYETEELVENVLNIIDSHFHNKDKIIMFDVATGSGAIGISIALEVNNAFIYASDISSSALKVAEKNAYNLTCKNIEFLQGDMLQPFIEKQFKADILVCNPPYIPINQQISDRVKKHEPHVALYGGEDGLDFYRTIFSSYQKVVNEKFVMAFECGYDQKKALEKVVNYYFPKNEYKFIKDINNKWRMLFLFNM